MKWKVQAQRKFAQGAYIPPNNNPTANSSACADRKAEHGAQKDTQEQVNRNIIRTKTSASNLLDVVCFQKLHKHVDPTVLLEQLKQSPPIIQAEPLPRKTLSSKSTLAKRLFRYLSTSKTFKNRYGMRLRSGAMTLKAPKGISGRDMQKKTEQTLFRSVPKKPTSKVHRSHFCTEDDKPLTFFTKKRKNSRSFARSEETAATNKDVSNASTSTGVAFAKKGDADSPIVLLKYLDPRAVTKALTTAAANSTAETSHASTSNTRDVTSNVDVPKQTRRKKTATGPVAKKISSQTIDTSRSSSTRRSRYADNRAADALATTAANSTAETSHASTSKTRGYLEYRRTKKSQAPKRRTSRDGSASPPRTRKKKRKTLGLQRRPLSASKLPLQTRRGLPTPSAGKHQRRPSPPPQRVQPTSHSKPAEKHPRSPSPPPQRVQPTSHSKPAEKHPRSPSPPPQRVQPTSYSKPGPKSEKLKRASRQELLKTIETSAAEKNPRSPSPPPQRVQPTSYSKPGPKSEKLKRALRQELLKTIETSAGTAGSSTRTPSLESRTRSQTSSDSVEGKRTAQRSKSEHSSTRYLLHYETDEEDAEVDGEYEEYAHLVSDNPAELRPAQEENLMELDPVRDLKNSPVSISELEEASDLTRDAEIPTDSPPRTSRPSTIIVKDIAGRILLTTSSLPECQVKLVKTTPEKINEYCRAALLGKSQQPAVNRPEQFLEGPVSKDISTQIYSTSPETQQNLDSLLRAMEVAGPSGVRSTLQARSHGGLVPDPFFAAHEAMDVAGPSGARATLQARSEGGLVPDPFFAAHEAMDVAGPSGVRATLQARTNGGLVLADGATFMDHGTDDVLLISENYYDRQGGSYNNSDSDIIQHDHDDFSSPVEAMETQRNEVTLKEPVPRTALEELGVKEKEKLDSFAASRTTQSSYSPTLYSINEIEKWINESKKYNPIEDNSECVVKYEPQMKMVKVNGAWTNCENRSNSECGSIASVKSDRGSPAPACPAQAYSTLSQVAAAPLRDVLRRCRRCPGCYRAKKVLLIGYLFQLRVASVLLERRGHAEFPADSDTSDDSDVIIDEPPRPPSRRFRFKRNTNSNNMITAPNGELLKDFYAQTFYIDVATASDYLLEFNWNWVQSKKKYIISAGICRRKKRVEITDLHLFRHINVLKELFMFMNKFFIGQHMVPITSVPKEFYFKNITDVITVSDVIDRAICRYQFVTWPKQSAANDALRSLISSGCHGRGSSSAPRNEKPSPSQPVAIHQNKNSASKAENAQHSTSPRTTQKKPDVPFFRFPRESAKQRASPGDTKPSCTIDQSDPKAQKEHREPTTTPKEKEGASAEKTKGTPSQKEKEREVIEAPVYHPTEEEFQDPIRYFKKITPEAAKYGLCKVVAPKWFKPKCTLNSDMRFSVTNQYICRLYNRWGPASREMCAIKSYLATQSVFFLRPPLLEGMEVNLPKLYQIVQRLGGLKQVIEKKRWTKVAEEMRLMRTPKADKKIDQIYVKYLLPYDTLLHEERLELMSKLEKHWADRSQKMLERARNPLHRKKRLLGESDSSEDEDGTDSHIIDALSEAEDCFVNGRVMTLGTFKKVAKKVMDTYFGSNKSPKEIEKCYWNLVLTAQDHLCVNTASIDTGEEGYGFPKNPRDPFGKHPWNLKMLSQNSGNVLRCLGPVLGVTVPTLHLGMVFSTSCWHRDPHGLPWMEYLHNGPSKVWYGIPESESGAFRRAAEALCPALCQNKLIWLPSDIAMIPPQLLLQRGVALSRLVQRPGEFVLVFPKAYSCSLATGYTESESVYFATDAWLDSVHEVFHEVRESCEPTMFSLEKLLVLAAREPRVPPAQLRRVHALLEGLFRDEIRHRATIAAFDVKCEYSQPNHRQRPSRTWNIREQEECEVCRTTLYLSRVLGLIEKSSVCPQHALQLLKARKRRCSYPAAEIQIFYKEEELLEILRNVEARLAATKA